MHYLGKTGLRFKSSFICVKESDFWYVANFVIPCPSRLLSLSLSRERERERERRFVHTLLVEWYKYRSKNALKGNRKKDEINKKDIAMTDVADNSIIHDFSLILRNLINSKRNLNLIKVNLWKKRNSKIKMIL